MTITTETQIRVRKHGFIFELITFFVFLLSTSITIANDSTSYTDPLRQADTSSPRDTLNSFFVNTSQFIEDYRNNRISEKSYRTFLRASQTLDFSTTAEGDSWFVRSRRLALLHEVLTRIDLPAENQIPGDHEVTSNNINQWRIPNTNITIVKITRGPRADQFLFSAEVVQELDRLYRQVKHLPYKPGVTIGIYEDLIHADSRMQAQDQELRNRLKPVDTSSPRATFEGFLDHVNRAYKLVSEANTALHATPPTISYKEAGEVEIIATNLLQRASDTLDLSLVPEALRQAVSIEATLLLKEILDRMLLPPLDATPTLQMVEAARKKTEESLQQNEGRFRWRLPNTQIDIIEIVEGERQGQFLFSAATIRQLRSTYNKIKDLPYRQAQFGGTELEYLSPGLSPGFYQRYIESSGYLLPQAHFMGRMIEFLPSGFKVVYGRQMVWQWTGLILCMLFTVLVVYNIYRYSRVVANKFKSPYHDWLGVLAAALILFIIMVIEIFIDRGLKFTSNLQFIVTSVITTSQFVLAALLVFLICKSLAETIIATPRMREMSSESALLRIAASIVGFLIAVVIIVDGLRSLGADLVPLLAGLGIGGLAVALAAQSTIANFIGGLILLSNKPVRVGDFCRYGEDPSADWQRIGIIEEINWISTRIRGIDRTVTTIPNAEFANMHIVNLTKRDQRLMRTRLQLRYETTSEQMRFILVKLRELLLGHPMVSAEPARVRMIAYGAYSKDVEIFCYLLCKEQNEFLAIQEDLLLRIEDIISKAGSGFAFPSQTNYITRDKGLDDKRREEAETEVGHLRFTSKLPFPDFDEEDRERLENMLDYPPKGSPEYKSHAELTEPKPDK